MKPSSYFGRFFLLCWGLVLVAAVGRCDPSGIDSLAVNKVADSASFYGKDDTLILRGKGRLTYLFWKVYDVELHLPQAVPSSAVLDEHPRALSFNYLRAFSAEQLRDATSKTVAERRGSSLAADINDGLKSINALWPAVRAGDCLRLYYTPRDGTTVFVNDRPLGVVKGAAFARVLFSIWLGDNPIDGRLRTALLGQ